MREEQRGLGRIRERGSLGDGFWGRFERFGGQSDGENGAFAGFAGDGEIAIHHETELLADDQAQAGAAIFPGGGRVGLGERLEQFGELISVHANPGINHFEHDLIAMARLGFAGWGGWRVGRWAEPAGGQTDGAALGEFAGVA